METLFVPTVAAEDIPRVPGPRYLPDYVTAADERSLAEAIDRLPWDARWRRRRQPYGSGYGPGDAAAPVPDWGRRLADRLLADGVTAVPFDHLLVNEYLPDQGARRTATTRRSAGWWRP